MWRALVLVLVPFALGAQDSSRQPTAADAELAVVRAAIADAFIAGARDSVDGHIERAITHARRAVALAPGDAESHYWLAAALGRRALRTEYRTALRAATESYREARQALALDSLHAGAHAVVGRFHEELSRYSRPVRMVLATVSGEADVKGVSRAFAERQYRRAIALDGSMVMYRHDYGRFLVGAGRVTEAAEQSRVARTLPNRTPADPWLRDDLAARIAKAGRQ
jgi:tetratricopeptide (TPR) repeat protein